MIEIGINLASSQFQGQVPALLQQARQAGVVGFIATGTSLEASEAVAKMALAHADVWATAGVHPHKASTWNAKVARRVAQLVNEPKVVAIGECGLDYNRMFSPREAQLAAFEAQIELAKQTGKPLFLHCRDAFDDFRAILAKNSGVPGVVHCFTGTSAEAKTILDLGMDLGITGWIADPRRGSELRDAVKKVPLNRLHLETDAPYLLPANMPGAQRRGKNVPSNLEWVAKALAGVLGVPVATLIQECTVNSRRLFGLPA